jgi:ketosteroid isomerase-like protein
MTMTTATTTDHIAIVSDLYAAFGRGDLAAMLAPLAEDVSWDADWADLFSQRAGLGVVAPRHGIDGAREFFALLDTFQVTTSRSSTCSPARPRWSPRSSSS